MKKLIAIVVLSALLLCSCTSHSGSSAAVSVESSSKTPTVSHEVDFTPLGQTYSRSYIIQQNLQAPTAENPGLQWAKMFITQKYQSYLPYDIRVELQNEKTAVKGLFADEAIELLTYMVHYRTRTAISKYTLYGDGYGEEIQIIALVSADGQTLTLSGIQYQGIVYFHNLLDYMKEDPRCHLKSEIIPVCDEGVKLYDTKTIMPDSGGRPVYIKEDVIAYLHFTGSKENPSYTLVFRDITTGNETLCKKYGDMTELLFKNGNLEVFYKNGSKHSESIDTYSQDGILLSTTEDYLVRKYYLPDSGVCILIDNYSIYLLDEKTGVKTLLLKGNHEAGEDTSNYSYSFPLDDHRFIYLEGGYEAIASSGVFDISTMSKIKMTKDTFEPIGVGNGKIYFTDICPYSTEFGLFSVDLDKLGSELQLIDSISDEAMPAFSPDMRYAAYLSDEDSDKFIVYDLVSQSKKVEFSAHSSGDWISIQFWDNNTVVAYNGNMISYEIQ